jgi:photoactive yellow protein
MQVANSFDTDRLQDLLGKTGKLALEKMAFGAIELDATGRILSYNKAEGDITGRDPKGQVGKRFFDEVAPAPSIRTSTAASCRWSPARCPTRSSTSSSTTR